MAQQATQWWKSHFSGFLVRLASGVVKWDCCSDKTLNNNQTYIHKGQWGIQTGCLGGPAQGTEPEQLSTGVVCWNSSRIVIGLI